jgi:hypothetical protein
MEVGPNELADHSKTKADFDFEGITRNKIKYT